MFEITEVIKPSKVSVTHTLKKAEILHDYKLALISRYVSVIGRKEVLSGKATFGVFGDGKELAQIAYAKNFRNGDWRSGYYRDQTFMLALGLVTPEELFAQLYVDPDESRNKSSKGRNMNNHHATENVTQAGMWKNLMQQKNSSGDIAPTAGQMPRLLGLAYASKLFRENGELSQYRHLSEYGNEVVFGSIGDASTSEGLFFESINAAGVLQVPMAIAVWDDGYGISVPKSLQTTKGSISDALWGFKKERNSNGILIYAANGWDYQALNEMFADGISSCRREHVPVLFHVDELTQPLGHTTSGSHERYKSKERLKWEEEHDPIKKMRSWLLEQNLADEKYLAEIEDEALKIVREAKSKAWKSYRKQFTVEKKELLGILQKSSKEAKKVIANLKEYKLIVNNPAPTRKDLLSSAKRILNNIKKESDLHSVRYVLHDWIENLQKKGADLYSKFLYTEHDKSALKLNGHAPQYDDNAEFVNGNVILNENFKALFEKDPKLVTFGEDTGKLGDVNQGMKGMQEKFGDLRVTDTGIREATIIGQGIGMALRGLKPIAEIQYLDYLIYALQVLSDDLATTHYRTKGGQIAPVIVRTRGHRLEGIWHSGSPLGMILNSMQGICVCVPRNMTQAAGMYNNLAESHDPSIVIEPLKAYAAKEKMPSNFGEFKVELGISEILSEGSDVTIVTYGWCVNIAKEAIALLEQEGISVELIDVQTLIPFDKTKVIAHSVKKTNKVVFLDEDVPGGASAYMMQKVIEGQKTFFHLDSAPRTISAQPHRTSAGVDGDYFSKPNADTVFDVVFGMMNEYNPEKYPDII
ncbi:thiamine pyrophosphate-dependent enzyme [Bacteroidales bacterium]|nr:thiamine pyrophosphate-dependent enzyme [Bacteroidales bacterium]